LPPPVAVSVGVTGGTINRISNVTTVFGETQPILGTIGAPSGMILDDHVLIA